ncbi:MAG: ATP-binding protein, partial [Candidatus Omnitrophica bacterium]|nr:ATP-binding protein [Candidatus Omnitrophota bacterium]
AIEAGAEHERFVQNSLNVITAFSHNHFLVNQQVKAIEQRLKGRIEERRRTQSQGNLPGLEVFQNGVIDLGQVVGTNIDARLKLAQFSGNLSVYGQYGMGKSNLNQYIIPQIIRKGSHVDIFDVASDYRDLLNIPGCSGLVLNPDNEKLNPLEPIGEPDEHLQFFWEITEQDFNLRPETKELLFNYTEELYRIFDVYRNEDPPTLTNLKEFLKEKKLKSNTTISDRRKIETALRKLDYILYSYRDMTNCARSFPLEILDNFSFVSYEIGKLSEDKRSWYTKLKLRQYYHQGSISNERHQARRIIVIDEAKGIFGKSRIGEATNYLKDMYTKSRSIGCYWIITDQFASELVDFTRASACQISFQHTVPKEIRQIATSMGFSETLKSEIPRIGRYRAFVKMTDFPHPFLIMTRKSAVEKHITDDELERLMQSKLAQLNHAPKKNHESKRSNINTVAKFESTTKLKSPKVEIKQNPLKDLEKFLRCIKNNPNTKLTDIYKALNYSGRRGNNIKDKARENQLIKESVYKTGRKGRSTIELELTQAGKEYINEE